MRISNAEVITPKVLRLSNTSQGGEEEDLGCAQLSTFLAVLLAPQG